MMEYRTHDPTTKNSLKLRAVAKAAHSVHGACKLAGEICALCKALAALDTKDTPS